MPDLLTNFIRLKHNSKMYFTTVKNNTYPYYHIILNIEIGDKILFTAKASSKEECRQLILDKLLIFTDCIEHLSKWNMDKTTL